MKNMKEYIDWSGEWERINQKTDKGCNVKFWDDFAPRFRKKPEPGKKDSYAEQFFELAELKPGDTVFDMGCASGTLAIPFAQEGIEVYAADFSSKMLEILEEDAAELGLSDRIHTIKLDWNEDWSVRDLPVCDVAISSRSLMPNSPQDAIEKLISVAKKRVCLGLWTHGEYDYDQVIAKAIGYEGKNYGIFIYILNMLFDMDLLPSLSYIKSPFRPAKFENIQQCLEETEKTFPEKLTPQQRDKLVEYIEDHLIPYEDKRGKGLVFDHAGIVTWAFVKWDIL